MNVVRNIWTNWWTYAGSFQFMIVKISSSIFLNCVAQIFINFAYVVGKNETRKQFVFEFERTYTRDEYDIDR